LDAARELPVSRIFRGPGMQAEKEGRGSFYNLLLKPDKLSKIQSQQRSWLRSKIKSTAS
jgi:hypothetical protein